MERPDKCDFCDKHPSFCDCDVDYCREADRRMEYELQEAVELRFEELENRRNNNARDFIQSDRREGRCLRIFKKL